MANLASIRCGFYRIPLPVVLSDSTHGEMRAVELNTIQLTDAEGAEGVGYTYTAGRNGAAVHDQSRSASRWPDAYQRAWFR